MGFKALGADIPVGSIKAAELAFAEVLAAVGLSTALGTEANRVAAGKRIELLFIPSLLRWAESRLLSCLSN